MFNNSRPVDQNNLPDSNRHWTPIRNAAGDIEEEMQIPLPQNNTTGGRRLHINVHRNNNNVQLRITPRRRRQQNQNENTLHTDSDNRPQQL